MWVWFLGNASLLYGLPLWLFAVWFRWHKRKNGNVWLRAVVTVVLAILFLLWSYFWFLVMVFGVQEEHSLFGGYVIVNRGLMLEGTNYDLCKSKALFFREDADWNTDFEIEYLERKYRQEFVEVPFDEATMLFYDSSVGTVRDRDGMQYRTVPVSPAHPQLPVDVELAGITLNDDYVELLTNWYIIEGCKELRIDRDYGENKYYGICMYFSGMEDIKKAAEDV